MAGVQRRFLYGEKAMLAQIWLKKGTSVPRHVHPAAEEGEADREIDEAVREQMDIKIFVDTDADIRVFRRIRRDIEQLTCLTSGAQEQRRGQGD